MEEPINPYASPKSTESPPWLSGEGPDMTRIARGLGLIQIGIGLCLLPALLPVITALRVWEPGLWVLDVIFLIVATGAAVNFLGSLFCLKVPPAAKAWVPMMTSVVAMLPTVGILSCMLLGIFGLRWEAPSFAFPVWFFCQAASTGGFILFLQRLDRHLNRFDLAGWAGGLLVVLIGLTVINGAVIGLAATGSSVGSGDAETLFWLDGIAWWLTFAVEAILVRATRKSIMRQRGS